MLIENTDILMDDIIFAACGEIESITHIDEGRDLVTIAY